MLRECLVARSLLVFVSTAVIIIHACLFILSLYIAVCDELDMIANGMISYNADMTAPYNVGTVATYSCNAGFELVGSAMRTCENAGFSGAVFSGQAPTCERKIYRCSD